jgi:hypothetical protein
MRYLGSDEHILNELLSGPPRIFCLARLNKSRSEASQWRRAAYFVCMLGIRHERSKGGCFRCCLFFRIFVCCQNRSRGSGLWFDVLREVMCCQICKSTVESRVCTSNSSAKLRVAGITVDSRSRVWESSMCGSRAGEPSVAISICRRSFAVTCGSSSRIRTEPMLVFQV